VIGLSLPNLSVSFFSISLTTAHSACDIFRSSTCHMIVYCLPLIVLFVTYQSKSLILNPKSGSVLDSIFQNSSAACSSL